MKVVIDLTSLADNFSGIERFAACLTLELVKHMETKYVLVFKVQIFSLFRNVVEQENVEYIVLPRCNKLIFNQMKLPNAIKNIDADWYLFLAFPVPILLFKKGMVSTIHDVCCWDCPETMNSMSKWYFRISHKVALKKCKNIITISEFSRKRIVDTLRYQQEKQWLIYCGVDETIIFNYNHKKDETEKIRKKYNLPDKYLLSLSTLEPRKNLNLLIRSYEKLLMNDDINIPLVLAGRKGWKIDNLLCSINENTRKNIIFTGFIENDDLAAVYSMASFFIFPSKYEGFGIPPLEAMACNTVVVSSDASSLPEVLGNAAIYFKNESIDSLTEVLKNALTLSKEELENYIFKGQFRVENFTWKNEGEKLYDLLTSK